MFRERDLGAPSAPWDVLGKSLPQGSGSATEKGAERLSEPEVVDDSKTVPSRPE